MTTQEILLDIIAHSEEHLTADRIYFIAKQSYPTISVATIYRNLTAMTEKGMIGHVSIPSGSARFDKRATSHPHGHCPLCGEVYDIPSESIDGAIEKTLGNQINSYQLTVSFPCEKCRMAENNK
ncbi:MAG: transcriptional repressor [Ruminococcaceae bacterium]|nr:transcriptional repressor [Oscillospiraceae bacterium]MBO4972915.1 transcriptional repressor [Clostridia bacterium]MBQ1258890.1 transcriptional repressor [Clostridia bacterium]